MTAITREQIEQILGQITDPHMGVDYVSAKVIQSIAIDEGHVSLNLQLGFPCNDDYRALVTQRICECLTQQVSIKQVSIEINHQIVAHATREGVAALPGVRNVIAVASGKGGVGKSTVAANVALALQQSGARVAVLDADIYGPSMPAILGACSKPSVSEDKKFHPVLAHGLQSMSIGYLIEEETPMIWRGPMVSGALIQLLTETLWDDVDYMIIDLPPGTGDIQLTLAQKVPVSGAIIVTTPQDLSLLDARKAYSMFRKVNVPVLGVVENMAGHVCSQCGHSDPIFGQGGGERMAQQYEIPFLGRLPLARQVCHDAERGLPSVIADPRSDMAKLYRDIATTMAARLALQARNWAKLFPKIVVENA